MDHDAKLVQECLLGNEDAFFEIVEAYKGYVFAVILNFIKDPYIAEDVAQEVFLQVYRSLPQFKNKNFKAWIGKIAVNKAIDFKRTQKKFYENEVMQEKEPISIAENKVPTPEDVLLDEEQKTKVDEVVAGLPEIYGRVLRKYYFEGKTYQQIALEENITVKAVESRLYRAKKLFKKSWRRDDIT